MHPSSNNNESSIDSIEHELYNPKNKIVGDELHHIGTEKVVDLPTSWGDERGSILKEAKVEQGPSFGIKLFLFSIVILLLAGAFTAWRVISLRNVVSSDNIDMSLDVAPFVEGGEQTPVTFTLLNRNNSQLQDVTITLLYKQGNGSQDEQEKIHEKRTIGQVKKGEYKTQNFKVVLFGSESETRDITFKLEYKVAGSNALFSKVISQNVVLNTPQISVHVDGPNIVSVGQNNTYTISIKNNSATSSLPSVLQLTLPNSFTLSGSNPKLSGRQNVWVIPSLKPGETKTVTLTGSVTGVQGETVTMRAMIGSQGSSPTTIGIQYASQTIDIKLRSSPLTMTATLSTDSGLGEVLRYGDRASVVITYNNSSDMPLRDVTISMLLAGNASLYKKIDPTNGYYDSDLRTISWDKTSVPELALLQAHKQGTLLVIIPIVDSGTNSPNLKASLVGRGSSLGEDDVVATYSKEWIAQGSVSIQAKTLYKTSPFVNNGPIPPTVNQVTSYGAHVIVSAQNALTNTKVSFILPVYVSWTGVTSDATKISYNSKTRTVQWDIGDIEAGKTVSSDIQLAVKPSQSHAGSRPSITSGIVLNTDDSATRAHTRTNLPPITTLIVGENWDVEPSTVLDGK